VDERLPQIRKPAATELFGHVQRVEAELHRTLPDRAAFLLGVGDRAGLLDLLGVPGFDRPDLALDEIADRVAQLDEFGRDLDDAHAAPFGLPTSR
jgi:hypothetical protein